MNKVLVTGSDGFIGINLCNYLEEHAFNVVKWDVKHGDDFTQLNIPSDVDLVYHLACIPQTQAWREPAEALRVNAWGARGLAKQAASLEIPVVYTSTLSVFGNAPKGVISADTPFFPKTDYAVSKLAGEFYFRGYHPTTRIVRLSNVYGPYQTPMTNQDCGVVGKFFAQAFSGNPLTVINPHQTRDYTYVGDVIEVLTAENVGTYPINLGSGRATENIAIANMIGAFFGEYSVRLIPERVIDSVTHRVVEHGYSPTPLYSGLEKTFEWWQSLK